MENLTLSEKIRLLARRESLTIAELARRTGQSRQNLNKKLTRDDFQVSDHEKIAGALDCRLVIDFIPRAKIVPSEKPD